MVVGQRGQDKGVDILFSIHPLTGLAFVWAETMVQGMEGSCCQYRPISWLTPESLNLSCLIPLEAARLKQAL